MGLFLIRVLNRLKLKLSRFSAARPYQFAVKQAVTKVYYVLFPLLRAWMPAFDNTLMLALTYRCQCACVHCSAALYRREDTAELSSDEARTIILDAARLGVSEIHFFGGEPLLVEYLPELIQFAKSQGLITRLDTNGLLLDEPMVLRLKAAGLDFIAVSVDSGQSDEHDRARACDGLQAKAIRGLELCVAHNMVSFMSSYVTKQGLRNGQIDRLIALAQRIGVRVRLLTPILCGRLFGNENVVFNDEDKALLRRYLTPDKVFWEVVGIDDPRSRFRCTALYNMWFYVSAYGEVQPCCFIPIHFGTVRNEPLRDILKRMRGSAFFKHHREHSDCPVNHPRFREKYNDMLNAPGPFPKRFVDMPNVPYAPEERSCR